MNSSMGHPIIAIPSQKKKKNMQEQSKHKDMIKSTNPHGWFWGTTNSTHIDKLTKRSLLTRSHCNITVTQPGLCKVELTIGLSYSGVVLDSCGSCLQWRQSHHWSCQKPNTHIQYWSLCWRNAISDGFEGFGVWQLLQLVQRSPFFFLSIYLSGFSLEPIWRLRLFSGCLRA